MNIEKKFNELKDNSNNLRFDSDYNLILDYNFKDCEKILIKMIQYILRKNNFIINNSTVKYEFGNMMSFIIVNIHEKIIKDSIDLKYYLINELELVINNDMRLFNKYFNNEYKIINDSFMFIVDE